MTIKHISEVTFNAALLSLQNMPRSEQKSMLTDAYENGALSGEQLQYAISYLGLKDA